MKLILLPGMDGTGDLFLSLLDVLPPNLPCLVVPLSNDCVSYSQQAAEISQLIGRDEVIILAESYSGKIAYELCKLDLNIKHIIFAASFINRPSAMSRLAHFLPINLIKKKLLPSNILSKLFFNSYKLTDKVQSVFESLKQVSNKTLKSRLHLISSIEEPRESFEIDATYIKPSNDLFVRSDCIKSIQNSFHNLEVITISGGHFIVQSNPEKCSEIIKKVWSRQG